MSEKINSFTANLRNKLNDIDDRLSSVKTTLESASKETQVTIEAKLEEVKAKLGSKRQEFKDYRLELQKRAAENQSEIKSKIETWKTTQQIEELNRRADRAEDYAVSGIAVAMAAIDEAEEAILEAIAARLDADNAMQ
jgi:chromosome segregation ATPase